MKTTLAAVLVLAIAAAAIAQSPVRPGRWEVTMQMQMAGSPVQMPEMKTTQCVTPDQVKDPTSTLPTGPQGRGGKNDCKCPGLQDVWQHCDVEDGLHHAAADDQHRRDDLHRRQLQRDDEDGLGAGRDDDEDGRQAARRSDK